MKTLQDFLDKYSLLQFFKYGLSSVVGISFLFLCNYFLTGILKLDERLGYFLAISLAYTLDYILALSFVFKKETSVNYARNFLIYTLIVIVINNAFFNLIYYFFHLHYLVITAINVLLFFPLRFLAQKHIVFK